MSTEPTLRPAVPRCGECGYDLSGIGAGAPGDGAARCPECGVEFDPASLRVLPDLPGFWRLCWVCLRPALAYAAVVLVFGVLVVRKPEAWGGLLACAGPPLLLGITLGLMVNYVGGHYVGKDRWWVVFVMMMASLTASAVVSLACAAGAL